MAPKKDKTKKDKGKSSSSESSSSSSGRDGNMIARIRWDTNEVPAIVKETIAFLESNGCEDEGIFRVTGSFKEINEMKAKYAAGQSGLDLSPYTIYSVAGLLSQFFNETEEPLFTFEMYPVLCDAIEIGPKDVKIACIRVVLSELPPGPRAILRPLFKMLRLVASKTEKNKMNSNNLSVALCPNLIRAREETIDILLQSEMLVELIQLCIENYDDIFMSRVGQLPDSIPDSFRELLDLAKSEIKAKMPKDWVDQGDVIETVAELPEEEKPIAKVQALCRRFLVAKRLKKLNYPYQTLYNLGVWDLMKHESNFVWAMSQAIKDFETRLGENKAGKRIKNLKAKLGQPAPSDSNWQAKVAEAEVKSMLAAFKAIIEVHNIILEEVTGLWNKQWPAVSSIGDLLLPKFRSFMVYNMYVDMFARVYRLINSKDANPELKAWMARETGRVNQSRTLSQLLELPFSHMSRYSDTLEKLIISSVNHFPSAEDTQVLLRSYSLISRLGNCMDQLKRQQEEDAVGLLQEALEGLEEGERITTVNRRLVRKGPIAVGGLSAFVFLFNDICIITRKTKQDSYRFQIDLDLSHAIIEDTTRFGFVLHIDDCDYEFVTKSAEEKVGWFVEFQSIIDHWKFGSFGVELNFLNDRENFAPFSLDLSSASSASSSSSSSSSSSGSLATPQLSIESITGPKVLQRLVMFLADKHRTEGLTFDTMCFACLPYDLNKLKNALNQSIDSTDLSGYKVKTIASALRSFFLDLPQPLIDRDWVRPILVDIKQTKTVSIEFLHELYHNLPNLHRLLLHSICAFLRALSIDHRIIALTWGQCFLRSPIETINHALNVQETEMVFSLLQNFDLVSSPLGSLTNTARTTKKKKTTTKRARSTSSSGSNSDAGSGPSSPSSSTPSSPSPEPSSASKKNRRASLHPLSPRESPRSKPRTPRSHDIENDKPPTPKIKPITPRKTDDY